MSEAITTARPYAQAAFEEAQKLADLKGWSEMLLSLAEAVGNPEVRAVVTSPRVPKVQVESLMEGLLGGQANAQQRNFVRILAENQRLLNLPEIAGIFEVLRADAEKTNMGLTTWKDAPKGKIQKFDVSVARNYLTEEEVFQLQRLRETVE